MTTEENFEKEAGLDENVMHSGVTEDKKLESFTVGEIGGKTTYPTKKRFTIFGVEFIYLCLLAIATAFIGWIAENTAKLVATGEIDSRFHILPFISPYGLVAIALHLVLKNPDSIEVFGKKIFKANTKKTKIWSNIISLLVLYVVVFVGELAIGNMWDTFFGVELWNYLDMPLHVTQYAGLIPTIGYGTGAYLLFKFAYTPALNYVRKRVNYNLAKWIVCTLGVVIVLDTMWLMVQIVAFGEAPLLWHIDLW